MTTESSLKGANARSVCTLARVGNCMISAWHGAADANSMVANDEVARAVTQMHPAGFALIVILQPGLPMPDATQRARLEQFYKRHAESIRALANVVLGNGFWASGMRSVLTALSVAERRSYPTRVFADSGAAAAWIEAMPGFALVEGPKLRSKLTELEASVPRPGR